MFICVHDYPALNYMATTTTKCALCVCALRVLLTGDLRSDIIEWMTIDIPSGEDIRNYAERLANELFPNAFQIWCRSRWITSLSIFRELGLLSNAHGLLHRTLNKFCVATNHKKESGAVKEWSVASSDDEAAQKTNKQPKTEEESKPRGEMIGAHGTPSS